MWLFSLLLPLCVVLPPAMANNHGDTAWSAYMKGWQTYDTPNRQRQDASSAYIKANSVTGNHLIRAWALSFSNGDVGSDTVQFTTGQERFISQYAYEWNGYKPRQIHLRLQNAGSYAGTLLLKACGVLIQFDVAKRCSD